jgi:nucleoside-diphosphate-sugar epimerase
LESGTPYFYPPGTGMLQTDICKVTASYAIENKDAVSGYNVSKKLSEQAAWKFMEDAKPSFDLTVINPDIIIGPMIQPVPKATSVNETNKFAVYNFFNGTYKGIEGLTFPFYHFVRCPLNSLWYIIKRSS